MLLLEQPVVLNNGVADAEKLLWPNRRTIKLLIPLLCFCSVLSFEMMALRIWTDDQQSSPAPVWRLLFAGAWPFLLFLALAIFRRLALMLPPRFAGISKRTLRLDEKKIDLSQTKFSPVSWRYARRWILSPLSEQSGFVMLTLEIGQEKTVFRRYWSMVLDEKEQKGKFVTEIEHARSDGKIKSPIIELVSPLPRRGLTGSFWASILAVYLLFHGLPLLMAGLTNHDSSGSTSRSTPVKNAHFDRVMRPLIQTFHISNTKELIRLFRITGAILTATGLLIYAWDYKKTYKAAKEANRLFDLEVERTRKIEDGNCPVPRAVSPQCDSLG